MHRPLTKSDRLPKTLRTAARVMNAIAGHDKRDSTSLNQNAMDYSSFLTKGIKEMRIGVDRNVVTEGLDPDVLATYERTIETF